MMSIAQFQDHIAFGYYPRGSKERPCTEFWSLAEVDDGRSTRNRVTRVFKAMGELYPNGCHINFDFCLEDVYLEAFLKYIR
jgi:hypothetical protein